MRLLSYLMQSMTPPTLVAQIKAKIEWEAKGTAEALRAYIVAQGEHQEWQRTQKGKSEG